MTNAIEVEGLTRSFGEIPALAGLDFAVEAGSTVSVLGPNSSGKTTTVRILSTLLRPDGGRASVAGFDVVGQPAEVRQRISLTGQYAALDERLTGRENLELVGDLHHLPRPATKTVIAMLLERLELVDAADRPVQTYSGGMRRRLDLAAGIVPRADVVMLDEPTTGLDPRGRVVAWELIEELVDNGATVLLTTQYLEEAERLADTIVVMDGGRVVAEGTSAEIKGLVGGQRLVVGIDGRSDLGTAAEVLRSFAESEPAIDTSRRQIAIPAAQASRVAARAVRSLDEAGIDVASLEIREPTLDDAFFALTGHTPAADAEVV
jgi:ABC-2 type transport system ATP-binding protein